MERNITDLVKSKKGDDHMSIINTGRGDDGQTDLFTGERVYKDSTRVEVYGTLDELSSFFGMAKHYVKYDQNKTLIDYFQDKIFILAAIFASSHETKYKIEKTDVDFLDLKIDEYEKLIKLPSGFVKPGGTLGSAILDVCRTVARRAERRAVELAKTAPQDKHVMIYLNRTSDLIYLMARAEEQLTSKEG